MPAKPSARDFLDPPLRLRECEDSMIAESTVACHTLAAAEQAVRKGAAAIRLDLTHCKLTELPELTGLRQLTELAAVGNKLPAIPHLGGCSSRLCVLSLGANQISSVTEPLPASLQHLGLGCNLLADGALAALVEHLPRSLQSLDLSQNLLCRALPTADALCGAPALRVLNLEGNPLCIRPDYPAAILRTQLGTRLARLDGKAVPVGGAPPAAAGEGASEDERVLLRFELLRLDGLPPSPWPTPDMASDEPVKGKKGKEAEAKAKAEAEAASDEPVFERRRAPERVEPPPPPTGRRLPSALAARPRPPAASNPQSASR